MPLPTLDKTWQRSINQLAAAQGTTTNSCKRLMRTIKNILIGFGSNPWTVRGSSNGTTAGMDVTDRWTVDGDIVKASAGVAHSWIVLRQSGVATNYELCIDMNSATAGVASLIISPSAGFTGGSTTARPTATDEIIMINATSIHDGLDVDHRIHVFQSSDGQCTRLSTWRGGTNNSMLWILDKPKNSPTGWTNPSYSIMLGNTSGIAASISGGSLCPGTMANALGRGRGTTTFNIALTVENIRSSTSIPETTGPGTVANDFDGSWPFFPIGLVSDTVSHRGRHGSLFDLWWAPTSVNDADTFPNDANNRQFICLGDLIFPWTGDSTVPLLT